MKNKIFQKVAVIALFSFLVEKYAFTNVLASEMPINVMQPTLNILERQELCLGYISSDFVEAFNKNKVEVSIENVEKHVVGFPISEDALSIDDSDCDVGYLESCGSDDSISTSGESDFEDSNQIGNGYSMSEIEDSTRTFEIEIKPHTEMYK